MRPTSVEIFSRFVVSTIHFRSHRIESWPALAWLAQCRSGSDVVDVIHGPRVEVAPDWFCEAVWDGPFEHRDFDQTDLAFGVGGRTREQHITFVSSGTTVDRLQALELNSGLMISNSLACLLAASGSRVDPVYPHYFRDFSSIRNGLSRYTPLLATSHGSARLIYFNNVIWDGKRLQQAAKPHPARDFAAFERYRDFLERSLHRIGENLGAVSRRTPFRL